MKPAPPVTNSRFGSIAITRAARPSPEWTLHRRREAARRVVIAGKLGGTQQRRHRPRVGPVALVDPREEPTVRDVVVQDVGDLELAAPRRREPVDDAERVGPEEVHPDRDQVALRLPRLLLEADHPAVGVELRDTEPLRVRHAVQQRPRTEVTRLELARDVGELRSAQDVVAEDAAERLGADEVTRQADRLRDAVGTGLIAVCQVEAEMRPVAEQLDYVTDALAPDDDEHLADAHPRERLDRVV